MAKFDTLLLDALLANSRWDAASQLFNRLPPPAPNAPLEKFWREWIQALIEAVTNPSDAPQSALVEALRSRVWAVGAFRRSAEILVQADRLTTARDVLEAGVRAYPASATLQTKLAEVREKVKASEAAQAAARPVPPPPLVAKAKAGAPSAAPAAKVAAKKPAPVAPESLLEELRQCRMAGDQPGVARVAREYLTGDRRRAEALVALARDWAAAGDRPAADLLLREVLRKHEAFPPARRLLAEFEAAAAKPK
jgi:hypothetical protein